MVNELRSNDVPRWLSASGQPLALRVVVAITFALTVGLTAVRIHSVLHVPPAVPEFNQGLTDFHNSVYFPALGFREGFNPYSREYVEHYPTYRLPPYSPFMFWLNYPYSLLPLEWANVVYFALSCVLLVALAASALAVCRVPLTIVNVFGLATLILVSRPGHINILLGQITLLLVMGAVWALELARRRPILGGVALALTTLKPTFAVPLVWLLFCRRDFRTAIAGVVIGGAAALAGLAPIIANHGLASVVESLKESQAKLDSDPMVAAQTTWTRIDSVALVGKLTGIEPDHFVVAAIAASWLLAAGAAVWLISRTPLADGADSLSGLIICTATLACVYHGAYDGLLLVLPWVAVSIGQFREHLPPAMRAVVWALLTAPAVNYFSTRVVITKFELEGPLLKSLTLINSACIAAACLIAMGVAVRSSFVLRTKLRESLATPTNA
jgi:hypothetical protein